MRTTARTERAQLARLLQIMLALRADRYPNTTELATLCEVSRRTIYRDLDTLRLAGVPVRYRSDRQGYELALGFVFQPPRLEESEAVALVVLANQLDAPDVLGLRRDARSAVWKLVSTLSEPARSRVLALAEAIQMIPDTSGDLIPDTPGDESDPEAVHATIREALALRRKLRTWLREPDPSSTVVTTKISPYRLVHVRATWCLIGRSTLHRRVGLFPVPDLHRVALTDEPYTIPPRFDARKYL